jgi:hypothetical protein
MTKISTDKDEIQLAKVTKSLLAMPRVAREDSKFAKKKTGKKKASPKKDRP